MAKYGATFTAFATTTGLTTAVLLSTAANRKAELVEARMTGSGSTAAADIMHRATFNNKDGTTAGTLTAVTPGLWDSMANAAGCTIGVAATVEPTTYGIAIWLAGFNQRGGVVFGVPQGEGVKIDNQPTNKHFGMRVISSAVGTVDGMLNWWEA
jgi:hypothetical protein